MAETQDYRISLRDFTSEERRGMKFREWLLWIHSDAPKTAGLVVSQVAGGLADAVPVGDMAGLLFPACPHEAGMFGRGRASDVDVRILAPAAGIGPGLKSSDWALMLGRPYAYAQDGSCTAREAADSLKAWARGMRDSLSRARVGKDDGFYEEGDLDGTGGLAPLSVLSMDERLRVPAGASISLENSHGTYALACHNYGPRRDWDLRNMAKGGG